MFKSWATSRPKNNQKHQKASVHPQNLTFRHAVDFYALFEELVAYDAKLRLLESMFNLNVFSLFEDQPSLLESEIIHQLELSPKRARKWLHLLCEAYFLIKFHTDDGYVGYKLPEDIERFLKVEGRDALLDYFKLCMQAENEDLPKALAYGEVSKAYSAWTWPPKTKEQSLLLERWMTNTAAPSIQGLLQHVDFSKVRKLLDVGGGDGTVACALVNKHPHLQATVYNLPSAVEIALENIVSQNLNQHVSVFAGDFIEEEALPSGFDLIVFTRVLFDWNKVVCEKLLRMAYEALPEEGMIVICELFKDDYKDVCLTCEYRYLFIDSLDAHVMKYYHEYHELLQKIGFKLIKKQSAPYCSILIAQKCKSRLAINRPWIKAWVGKIQTRPNKTMPPSTQRKHFYNYSFSLLANGARLKIVEAAFRLKFFSLFTTRVTALESEIIEHLNIEPHRAKKWLYLLCDEGFLIQVPYSHNQSAYELPDALLELVRGPQWVRLEVLFSLWHETTNENLSNALQSGKLSKGFATWHWPPVTEAQSIYLEHLMKLTARNATEELLKQVNFAKIKRVLDVGGGDGTIACSLAREYPNLHLSVYNLPIPADIARKNIAAQSLSHRVNVVAGNFIDEETFPAGFDCIVFSRVLYDWSEANNRKLLQMTYDALPSGGIVVINEFYKDDCPALCFLSEYRYLFIDDFDEQVMKTSGQYLSMLKDIGFDIMPTKKSKITAFHAYSVLIGKK
jgi:16S rRNA G1207 methylase RsmC